jgi:peptide/nickel transport system permease protein
MSHVFYLQKVLRALLTVWAIVTFVFVILRISGDAAMEILGVDIGPEAIEAFRRRWGLDRPLWEQYLIYFANLLRGDFGISLVDGRPALEVVLDRVPKTLALMVPTTILTFGIGIPAGIYAALHRNSWIDRGTMAVTVMSFSLPNFVVGILLILLFSVTWRLLPTAGSETWLHYIMPVITMSTADAAVFARFSRSSMLEVLNQPYMRTALAKGIPWHTAVRRHAVPNTAIPTVTIAGFFVGSMIAGGVITENVFAWPGVGRLFVSAVGYRDTAVVQVIVILIAVTMVTTNLVIDILYGWLDPRVRSLRTGD